MPTMIAASLQMSAGCVGASSLSDLSLHMEARCKLRLAAALTFLYPFTAAAHAGAHAIAGELTTSHARQAVNTPSMNCELQVLQMVQAGEVSWQNWQCSCVIINALVVFIQKVRDVVMCQPQPLQTARQHIGCDAELVCLWVSQPQPCQLGCCCQLCRQLPASQITIWSQLHMSCCLFRASPCSHIAPCMRVGLKQLQASHWAWSDIMVMHHRQASALQVNSRQLHSVQKGAAAKGNDQSTCWGAIVLFHDLLALIKIPPIRPRVHQISDL